ncbi:MAG: hypothetical protein WCW44_05915 [archaeon]|jgi:hypothetical protein
MISKVCADVLKELKRIGVEIPFEHEIALNEFEKLGTAPEVKIEWKRKSPLTLT